MVCAVCHQPECSRSSGGQRPAPGGLPSQLLPGEREYRGYQEWAIHPSEAVFVLHRGYALVDGQRCPVEWLHNEACVTQVRVWGSDPVYSLEERYYGPSGKEPVHAG